MADDMDMSEWQVQTRGVSPWLLVLFIVLTIGGLLGCYFLYTKFAAAQKVTDTLLAYVKDKAKKPLDDAQIPEKLKVSSSPVRYEKEFWNVIKQYLERGAKYDDLVKTVGWTGREELVKLLSSASELEALFGIKNFTSTTDVRSACEAVGTSNRSLQAQAVTLRDQLDKALADLKATKDLMEGQRKEQQGKINDLLAQLRKVQDEHNQKREELRKLADQANDKAGKIHSRVNIVKADAATKAKQLAAAKAKHENVVKAKEQKIAELSEVEEDKPGPDGKILQVNSALRFAVINIGERDTVEKGEYFKVFEKSRREVKDPKDKNKVKFKPGDKIPKGLVRVRSVRSRTSAVDIVDEYHALNPIISGDYVERKDRRRKHDIKVRAQRRAKAGGK